MYYIMGTLIFKYLYILQLISHKRIKFIILRAVKGFRIITYLQKKKCYFPHTIFVLL